MSDFFQGFYLGQRLWQCFEEPLIFAIKLGQLAWSHMDKPQVVPPPLPTHAVVPPPLPKDTSGDPPDDGAGGMVIKSGGRGPIKPTLVEHKIPIERINRELDLFSRRHEQKGIGISM